MLNFLLTLLAFIISITVLVSFHEYGHFVVARIFKVKVLRFSLGFGKCLCFYRAKSGTEFWISLVPLGGYVKMLDTRESDIPKSEWLFAFNHKPAWQRLMIVLAGPGFSFLLAILLFWWIAFWGFSEHKYYLWQSLSLAVLKTINIIFQTFALLFKMLIGKIKMDSLHGPLSIAQVAVASLKYGFLQYLNFLAVISIALGVINLLPIPVLDGGQASYYLVEMLRGKPLSQNFQNTGNLIGIFLLMVLMVVAILNDLGMHW